MSLAAAEGATTLAGAPGLAAPHRPRVVAVANRLGAAFERAGVGRLPWSADALMEAAAKKTGLADFGDPRFRVPLEVLLESIAREARLHTVGKLITKGRIVSALATRLRIEALIAREPRIEAIPVTAPIVIAGLQRTGTTMLHRLLSRDPGLRALASWEALNPVPWPRRAWHRGDPRVQAAVLAEHGLRYMAPEFFAIHPVEAHSPEEEVVLLDLAFLSTVPEATLHVPSYAAWLEDQDQRPAYEYLERVLQVLSYQRPGERWVLKTPHHLEWLDTLFEVFPESLVIQTHRDPQKTIASLSSMITHGRGVFSDEVDPREVAAHWSRKVYRMVDRAMESRDRVGEARFVDVSYYALMKDPMAEVERIYAAASRPLTAEASRRMASSRERNQQHKYGRHRYQLADFGLSPEEVERHIAPYRARFDVRHE